MVTVAVRALAAVGVNVRLRRQLAPATTVAPFVQVVPAAMAKSPGFEPARAMLVMLRVAVPLLVRVTVCTGLVVLRRRSPKARLVGAKVTAGTMPVPASDTDCGLLAASSVMVTVAVRALAAVGVNVRLRRQLAPATTVAPFVQVVPAAMAKSPGFKPARAMLVMLRVAVPLLVRVTVCTGLVVLRSSEQHTTLLQARPTAVCSPIPASDTDCGLPGVWSLTFSVAVRPPVAAGVNATVKAFFFNDTATTEIYTLSLHDALPISKSPGFKPARAMLVMLRVAVPLLVRVTVCTGLVVLRRWSPKARLVGAKVTAGAMPIPASDTDCGLPGASSVMVTVAVRAPVAAGVKLMLIVQLAPGATEPAPVGQGSAAHTSKPQSRPQLVWRLLLVTDVPPLF